MTINVDINEQAVRELIADYLTEKTGQPCNPSKVKIEVKSKQNYKSEWEAANFRASYSAELA